MKLWVISEENYIDPDSIYADSVTKWQDSTNPEASTGMLSFIYTDAGKMLYAEDDAEPHVGIIMRNPAHFGKKSSRSSYAHADSLFDDDDLYDWAEGYRRDKLELTALVGRTGNYKGQHLVSFWNQKRGPYQKHLQACIDRLIADRQITANTQISIPKVGTFSVAKVGQFLARFDQAQKPQMADPAVDKQREVHLARGTEKKRLMKDLGLATHSDKSPWQAAMEKTRQLAPGQKWWATTSESKD